MTTMMKTGSKVVLALMLGVGGATVSQNAKAADWSFSFGIGGYGRPVVERCEPVVVAKPVPPPVRTVRTWVPERYETREEQVLVAPERHDRVWVEPEYQTRYDRHGCPTQVLVRHGYWKDVCIPARYETRCTKVLIPGYWTEVVVDDRHDHRYDRYEDRNDRYEDRNGRYSSGRFDPHHDNGNHYGRDKKDLAVKVAVRK